MEIKDAKEIEQYRAEISILGKTNKSVKVKTRKARNIKRKNEIKSSDKNAIIKEELTPKIQQKPGVSDDMKNEKKFFRPNKIFQDQKNSI